MDKLVTQKELAAMVGRGPGWTSRWVASGLIPPPTHNRGTLRRLYYTAEEAAEIVRRVNAERGR